jgi:glucose/arabinose dehydrogenase
VPNENYKITSKYYACDKSALNIFNDCDLSASNVEGYDMVAMSTRLYDATATPRFVEGIQGKALEVISSYSESVILSEIPVLNSTTFSVSFWTSTPSAYDRDGHVLSSSCLRCFPGTGWNFEVDSSSAEGTNQHYISFNLYNNTGGIHSSGKVEIPSNEFVHIVGTFNGSKIRIFENGELANEGSFEGILGNTSYANPFNRATFHKLPLKVGTGSYCNSCFLWTGAIDELRIYNKTITESEVKILFDVDGLSDIEPKSDGLIGYWNFEETLNNLANNLNGRVSTLISSIVAAPDGRLFFAEKNTGHIRIMKNEKVLDTPFAVISDHYVDAEQGLLGLAIDPHFKDNRFLYLYYTYEDSISNEPFNRIIRLTDDGHDRALENPTVILDRIPASRGFHSGGALAFGSDDKLYATVGDAALGGTLPQDPASLLGKVLRMNRDGTIPSDNPFPGSPVYTIGHRNMYGIAFDNNGLGLLTENGPSLYDELNVIEKGGNYGYPTFQRPDQAPELASSSITPVRSYKQIIAPTQAIFYDANNTQYLTNKFLFGSVIGKIYAVYIDKDNGEILEDRISVNLFPFEAVVAIAKSTSGDIYFGGYSIYKLDSVDDKNKSQVIYPVQMESSLDVTLANIQLDYSDTDNTVTANVSISVSNVNATGLFRKSSDHFLAIALQGILENEPKKVFVVANDVNDGKKIIPVPDFTVTQKGSRGSDYIINIPLNNFLHSNISGVLITAER